MPRSTGPMMRFNPPCVGISPVPSSASTPRPLVLEVADDLAEAEDAHRDDHEVDAVGQLRQIEAVALVPELTSVPTRPSSKPNMIMPSACSSEPCASTIEATRPSTISEKYSAGPNFNATSASGGAKSAMSSVQTVPAKNEPIAAVASALPAFPWRAIW